MRFDLRIIIGILLTIFASTSFAQGTSFRGWYFGGGLINHQFKDQDERITGAVMKFGYDVTNFLAIEAHGGATIEETLYREEGSYKVRAEHAGIYARANWRLTNVTLYGLAGYGYYKAISDFTSDTDSFYDGSAERKEKGLSYGIGLDLFGSRRTAASLSWMQLINEKDEFDSELNVQAIYLGITHYFKPQKTTHAPN